MSSPIANRVDTIFVHVTDLEESVERYPDLSEFTFKDPDGNMIMVCTCL